MASVSLRNVSENFHEVRGLSFEVADHEFIVLAGRSRRQLSGILRLIAGLDEISEGEIHLGERRIDGLAAQDRGAALIFASGALYPHLSVQENLAFGLKMRKYTASEIKKRISDSASVLGLDRILSEKPAALARADRQRVALGRAIVAQPKLVLFDQPMDGLHPALRLELAKLHDRFQTTMIYATDDPAEALALGGRLILIDRGAVVQIGPAAVAYDEPVNTFVAGFLGVPPMSFVRGTLRRKGDYLQFSESEEGSVAFTFPVALRPQLADFAGPEIIAGLRPEQIALSETPAAQNKAASFPALVESIEPLGASTLLHLQTGGSLLVCRAAGQVGLPEVGRRMRFEVNAAAIAFFDPVSTSRIIETKAAR